MRVPMDGKQLARLALVSSPGWAVLAFWIAEGAPMPPLRIIVESGRAVERPVDERVEVLSAPAPPSALGWGVPQ